eukprot:12374024-Alexandrium_andersonii.AAC.1
MQHTILWVMQPRFARNPPDVTLSICQVCLSAKLRFSQNPCVCASVSRGLPHTCPLHVCEYPLANNKAPVSCGLPLCLLPVRRDTLANAEGRHASTTREPLLDERGSPHHRSRQRVPARRSVRLGGRVAGWQLRGWAVTVCNAE